MNPLENLKSFDPDIYEVIVKETQRQREDIELIASENFVSEAVLEANGSTLTNKYAEGYPGKRYYGGCEHVDVSEDLARKRLCLTSHEETVYIMNMIKEEIAKVNHNLGQMLVPNCVYRNGLCKEIKSKNKCLNGMMKKYSYYRDLFITDNGDLCT